MSKKTILILGITSIIGYRFYQLNKNYRIFGLCRKWPFTNRYNIFEKDHLEIKDIDNILYDIQPDVVINCISIGNVDECELNPKSAYDINYKFTVEISNLVNKYNITMINFSSSLIYDGFNPPYSENSIAKPLNKYGKLKLDTDTYLRNSLTKNILIRPTTIFGNKEVFHRDNPVNFIINKIINNEEILLVDDVVTNFLFVDDLVNCIELFLENNIYGEFNIGGNESISRYDLGIRIKKILNHENYNIKRCNSNFFKTIARRPLNTTLLTKKLLKSIKLNFTDLDDAIKSIIKEKGLL